MNQTAVMTRGNGPSPRSLARMTGLFFLLTMLTGIFSEGFVSGSLVADTAAKTAANIVAHKGLLQAGYAVYIVEMACSVITTALFYVLLRPVNATGSLVAACLSLAGGTIKAVGRLFFIAPLLVLGGADYLNVFQPEQLQSLAFLFLKLNDRAAEMALVFFGFEALVAGYLMYRSTYLPRILGVVGLIGGVTWLTFLWSPLAHRLFFYFLPIALLGALLQIGWLLVVGVNVEKWNEKVRGGGRLLSR